jgi:hypothetical protein
MKALINTMFVYWILLLSISLGAAALIYVFWLQDKIV